MDYKARVILPRPEERENSGAHGSTRMKMITTMWFHGRWHEGREEHEGGTH